MEIQPVYLWCQMISGLIGLPYSFILCMTTERPQDKMSMSTSTALNGDYIRAINFLFHQSGRSMNTRFLAQILL